MSASYGARYAIILPAIAALCGAAFILADAAVTSQTDRGGYIPASAFGEDLFLTPVNRSDRKSCECTKQYGDGASKPQQNKKCQPLTPAERMGMSVRIASV